MSLTFNDGDKTRQFANVYDLVEHACKSGSPFLQGDANLVELTKWYAVENKDKALILKLEDAGHDMSEYIERHITREAKLKQQLANL